MDRKTWIAVAGLAISVLTNYVQTGRLVARAEENAGTAQALTRLAEAYESRIACE